MSELLRVSRRSLLDTLFPKRVPAIRFSLDAFYSDRATGGEMSTRSIPEISVREGLAIVATSQVGNGNPIRNKSASGESRQDTKKS